MQTKNSMITLGCNLKDIYPVSIDECDLKTNDDFLDAMRYCYNDIETVKGACADVKTKTNKANSKFLINAINYAKKRSKKSNIEVIEYRKDLEILTLNEMTNVHGESLEILWNFMEGVRESGSCHKMI